MSKESRIKTEIAKLNKIFENIPEQKKKLCEKLIQNAAYMSVTLEDLQEIVNEEGPIYTSKNGNGFDITQEHPAQKSYIAMIAKYSNVMSQLQNLLPDAKTETVSQAGESLAMFVAKGKKVELR